MTNCIGLFGTCGNSTWREAFISKYDEKNIQYFNPQVKYWSTELAKIEADHMAKDAIILFPITDETYGTGSLAELGFAYSKAIMNPDMSLIVMVDSTVKKELADANSVAAKESNRARALVLEHINKLSISNVYVVSTLEEMLGASILLWNQLQRLKK